MNGTAPGGPRFSCHEQPMDGDWCSFMYYPHDPPQGILADGWSSPAAKPQQQYYFNQFFFKKRNCGHPLSGN